MPTRQQLPIPVRAADEDGTANSDASSKLAAHVPRTREGDSPPLAAGSSRLARAHSDPAPHATRIPSSPLAQEYRVFTDPTGRRAEIVRRMGYLVTGLCVAYTLGVVLSLAGSNTGVPGGLLRAPGAASSRHLSQAEAKRPSARTVARQPAPQVSEAPETKDTNDARSNSQYNGAQDNLAVAHRSAPAIPTTKFGPASPRGRAPSPTTGSDRSTESPPKPIEPTDPPGPSRRTAAPNRDEPKPDHNGAIKSDQPPTDEGSEASGPAKIPPPADRRVTGLVTPVGQLLSDLLNTA